MYSSNSSNFVQWMSLQSGWGQVAPIVQIVVQCILRVAAKWCYQLDLIKIKLILLIAEHFNPVLAHAVLRPFSGLSHGNWDSHPKWSQTAPPLLSCAFMVHRDSTLCMDSLQWTFVLFVRFDMSVVVNMKVILCLDVMPCSVCVRWISLSFQLHYLLWIFLTSCPLRSPFVISFTPWF
jgi:hypothetical protein